MEISNSDNQFPPYLNISDPKDLEKFPELNIIREAVIAWFDYLINTSSEPYNEHEISDIEKYWRYISMGLCKDSSQFVGFYLYTFYPQQFEITFYDSLSCKHFSYHHILIIKSEKTNLVYALSPANIFTNTLGKGNNVFPQVNINNQDTDFQRSRFVLVDDSFQKVIKKLVGIEGGSWRYSNVDLNYRAKILKSMIKVTEF